ncbi:hypothetical protein BD413DRAFT_572312, partial [Trametes elegans]
MRPPPLRARAAAAGSLPRALCGDLRNGSSTANRTRKSTLRRPRPVHCGRGRWGTPRYDWAPGAERERDRRWTAERIGWYGLDGVHTAAPGPCMHARGQTGIARCSARCASSRSTVDSARSANPRRRPCSRNDGGRAHAPCALVPGMTLLARAWPPPRPRAGTGSAIALPRARDQPNRPIRLGAWTSAGGEGEYIARWAGRRKWTRCPQRADAAGGARF